MADIHHDQRAYLVSRQQVTSPEPAESDRHVCPGLAVNYTGEEVEARGPIDGHDRDLEIDYPTQKCCHCCAGGTSSAGTEQGVNRDTHTGPGAVGRHLPDAICSSQPSHPLAQLRTGAGRTHPDRNLDPVQCPGDHPAVSPVVSGARRHQHTGAQEMRVAVGQDDRHRPAGILHEGGELDAGTDGELVPAVGLFGSKNGEGGHRER
jgi:hypothetical protein